MEKLSEHFTLDEFTRSTTAARRNINNALPPDMMPAATKTAQMLEGIRAHLSKLAGREISITLSSGYRCPELNRAIGSSDTSDHPKACAADWRADGFGTPVEICKALAPMVGVLGIGQLINEYPGPGGWVHTSTRTPTKAANRIITITARGTSVGILEA